MYLQTMTPVLTSSAFVKRNEQAVEKIADELANEEFSPQRIPEEFLPKKNSDDLISFICISTALSFCSTDPISKEKFEARINGNIYNGSVAIVGCLGYAINHEWPLLNTDYLKKISLVELEAVFKGNIRIPLVNDRLQILREIGNKLEKYKGDFKNLFQENNFQAGGCSQFNGIVPTLVKEFPLSFEDVAYWPHGLVGTEPVKIHFAKKAQLAVLLYNNQAKNIKDIVVIGPTIDSQVIRPLIERDALQCSQALTEKINQRVIFLTSSREVIELRVNAAAIIDLLLVKINERRLKANPPKQPITHGYLDKKLWDYGHQSAVPQIIVSGREF